MNPIDKDGKREREDGRMGEVPPSKGVRNGNQGEGDRVAARSYERKLRQFVASGRVPESARAAAHAVDSPENAKLAAAEARGRAPAQRSVRDRVVGLAHRAVNEVKDRIARLRRG